MSFKDMTQVIRAAALRGYADVMQELHVPHGNLLKQFAISEQNLSDDDALLAIGAVCGLLEASSLAANCPDLGLRIARQQDHEVLGVLGLVMMNASSPAEAASIVSRFIFLQGTALRIDVENPGPLIPDTVAINFFIDGVAAGSQRQALDLLLGMSFQTGQMRDPLHRRIKAVSLPHSVGGSMERYQKFFGLPVYDNQSRAALHCDAVGWHTPIGDVVPEVGKIVKEHLERNFPVPGQSLADRVRFALRPMIGTPQANREDVARILAIHPRTLHRQLLAEHTSFQDIKDTLRKELALKYLTETDATLAQLSALLGFPEQSALSRASKKWFGLPPTAVRRGRGQTITAIGGHN